jgi:hypothetical protein
MAIAEHDPSESYYPRLAQLPRKTLHEFAATKETNLPHYVKGSSARANRRRRLSDYAKGVR